MRHSNSKTKLSVDLYPTTSFHPAAYALQHKSFVLELPPQQWQETRCAVSGSSYMHALCQPAHRRDQTAEVLL